MRSPAVLLPRRRFTTLSGANLWAEWWDTLRHYGAEDRYEDRDASATYETAFASVAGCRHAVGFGAGRMGFYAILEALGIGPGDEIVLPAFTCVVVPNAVLYRGARPVYADIDPQTFNIDVDATERAITPRTKALYAQHTFGLICDIDGLVALGRRRGLPVIEDVGHALGAGHRGRPAGSLGDVSFFTTERTKVLNTVVGGMVATSNPALASRLRALRERCRPLCRAQVRQMQRSFLVEFPLLHPRFCWVGRLAVAALDRRRALFAYRDELSLQRPTEYPFPARLSSFQARLGLSQLARLEEILAHRRRIGLALEERIGWLGDRLAPGAANHAFLRYSWLMHDRASFERAFSRHFDLSTWFTSIAHGRRTGLEAIGYTPGSCPRAEEVSKHVVNLPTHPRIDPELLLREVERNARMLREGLMRVQAPVSAAAMR